MKIKFILALSLIIFAFPLYAYDEEIYKYNDEYMEASDDSDEYEETLETSNYEINVYPYINVKYSTSKSKKENI